MCQSRSMTRLPRFHLQSRLICSTDVGIIEFLFIFTMFAEIPVVPFSLYLSFLPLTFLVFCVFTSLSFARFLSLVYVIIHISLFLRLLVRKRRRVTHTQARTYTVSIFACLYLSPSLHPSLLFYIFLLISPLPFLNFHLISPLTLSLLSPFYFPPISLSLSLTSIYLPIYSLHHFLPLSLCLPSLYVCFRIPKIPPYHRSLLPHSTRYFLIVSYLLHLLHFRHAIFTFLLITLLFHSS